MDIQPRTTVAAPVDDKAWIISTHGIDSTITGTARVEDFSLVDGTIPGGTAVVKDGDVYRPAAAGDGDQVPGEAAVGHVYETVAVSGGSHVGIAVLWHGVVAVEHLPGDFGPDNHAPHVLYV